MENIKTKQVLFFIILLAGCAPNSSNIIIEKKISDRFYIGHSRNAKHINGLWEQKGFIYTDEFPLDTMYYLIARNPTHYVSDNGILIIRDRKKKPEFIIIKMEGNKQVDYYSSRDSTKYLKKRIELNISDSLMLKTIER